MLEDMVLRFDFNFFGNPIEKLLSDQFKHLHLEFLRDLFSPSFFRAIPALDIVSIGKQIFFGPSHQIDQITKNLNLSLQPVQTIISDDSHDTGDASNQYHSMEKLLEIYFTQVLVAKTVYLDLRISTLSESKSEPKWQWNPKKFHWTWSESFQMDLKNIYLGFYLNDDTRFCQGLSALNLLHAKSLFESHFGQDTSQVIFRYKDFIDIFTKVFSSCVEHKVQLHPEFMPFGIMLTCLYHSLSGHETPMDVARIFKRVLSAQGITS
jgi:hypothetical protein